VIQLNNLHKDYNFKISATKSKIMFFNGKHSICSEIILHDAILEQVTHFNYLGCNVTCYYDEDINEKISTFLNIFRTIS
jgi:hypothetical protein